MKVMTTVMIWFDLISFDSISFDLYDMVRAEVQSRHKALGEIWGWQTQAATIPHGGGGRFLKRNSRQIEWRVFFLLEKGAFLLLINRNLNK